MIKKLRKFKVSNMAENLENKASLAKRIFSHISRNDNLYAAGIVSIGYGAIGAIGGYNLSPYIDSQTTETGRILVASATGIVGAIGGFGLGLFGIPQEN
ncbi:MAG: hypothetical protein ABH840_02170 [Nanoarchaeota archaeon]